MENMKKVILSMLCCLLLVGCLEEEAPIEVSAYSQYNPLLYREVNFLKITSLADSVHITGIKLNRGNCAVGGVLDSGITKFDKVLNYGQSLQLPVAKCENVLEVEVETDKGTWSFNF